MRYHNEVLPLLDVDAGNNLKPVLSESAEETSLCRAVSFMVNVPYVLVINDMDEMSDVVLLI